MLQLDYSVTDAKLREVFQLAGNAVEVAVRYDSEGKSLGRAIVRFEHPMEAVQAICILETLTYHSLTLAKFKVSIVA